jgi:hypothetical protein
MPVYKQVKEHGYQGKTIGMGHGSLMGAVIIEIGAQSNEQ